MIAFQSGLSGQITLTTGEIPILEALDVQGPGAEVIEVNGNDASRIFYVDPATSGSAYEPVRISGLTLREGSTTGAGGALYSDRAALTLEDLVVDDNYGDSAGGAVSSHVGKLSIINSSFTGNLANDDYAGAVYVDRTEASTADDVEVLIRDSSFIGNEVTAGNGGALYLGTQGNVVIENTTVSDNSAGSGEAFDFGDRGGGIVVGELEGDLTISNSTFAREHGLLRRWDAARRGRRRHR